MNFKFGALMIGRLWKEVLHGRSSELGKKITWIHQGYCYITGTSGVLRYNWVGTQLT